MLKRVCGIVALSALLLCLCACAPAEPVSYSVTVACGEEFTEEEAADMLREVVAAVTQNGKTVEEKALAEDSYGFYADFDLVPGEYDVTLKNVPSAYFVEPQTQHVTDTQRNVVFAISKEATVTEQITYSVTVLYPDGRPAEGIAVEFCTTPGQVGAVETCRTAAPTNADGTTSIELPKYGYDIHINDCPDGYAFDRERYKVTPSAPSVTVSLTAAN